MPSDIAVMLTVGAQMERHAVGFAGALPFVGATVAIASLPLLFHGRAERTVPNIRTWMNAHAWLINIISCLVFIALIL